MTGVYSGLVCCRYMMWVFMCRYETGLLRHDKDSIVIVAVSLLSLKFIDLNLNDYYNREG